MLHAPGGPPYTQRSFGTSKGATTGTSTLTVVADVAKAKMMRVVTKLRVHNRDTVDATVRLRILTSGPTHSQFLEQLLVPGASLEAATEANPIKLANGEAISLVLAGAITTTEPYYLAEWGDVPVDA